MGTTIEELDKNFLQRALIARQLAETCGLDSIKILDFLLNDVRKINMDFLGDHDEESLKDFNPEICGFKTDFHHLNAWAQEESAQHLLNNIFCFYGRL